MPTKRQKAKPDPDGLLGIRGQIRLVGLGCGRYRRTVESWIRDRLECSIRVWGD
jgi:hypothetical protein